MKVQDGPKARAKLEPDPDRAWAVKKMFQMAVDSSGCKEIAKTLNSMGIPSSRGKRWGKGRVHAVLTDEVYAGTLLWGAEGKYHREVKLEPIRVERAFPAIVARMLSMAYV